VMGTLAVLEAVRQCETTRSAVFITTDKCYENKEWPWGYREDEPMGGHDPYSSSKASAELVISSYIRSFFNPKDHCKTHNTLVASARAGNVIGGGDWGKDRIITDIVRSFFESDKPVSVRNPEAVRPWQFVLEPLAGYLTLAKHLYGGRKEISGAWNFGPKEKNHIPVRDLLNETISHLGTGSFVVDAGFNSKHEATLLKLDSTKARNDLKWRSDLSASSAIKLTMDWYKNYYSGGNVIDFTNRQIKDFFKQYGKNVQKL